MRLTAAQSFFLRSFDALNPHCGRVVSRPAWADLFFSAAAAFAVLLVLLGQHSVNCHLIASH